MTRKDVPPLEPIPSLAEIGPSRKRLQKEASDRRLTDREMRFRTSLDGTDPEVWRRIAVPGAYTFWDLHVAVQDAMGWNDSHLHRKPFLEAPSSRAGRKETSAPWR